MTRNLGNFCKHKADDAFLMQMSKNFLVKRSIRVSGYRKNELFNLASEAFKQKVEEKCNLADESARQLVNGTVSRFIRYFMRILSQFV